MSDMMWIGGILTVGIVLFIVGYLIGTREKDSEKKERERSEGPALKEKLDRVVVERDEMKDRLTLLTGDLVQLREAEMTRESELEELRNDHLSQGAQLATMRSEHDELVKTTREMRQTNESLAKASSMQEHALAETTTLLKTLMGQLQALKGDRGEQDEADRDATGDTPGLESETETEDIPEETARMHDPIPGGDEARE